jgi:hypothetical protein
MQARGRRVQARAGPSRASRVTVHDGVCGVGGAGSESVRGSTWWWSGAGATAARDVGGWS